jgi:hypothetical protein
LSSIVTKFNLELFALKSKLEALKNASTSTYVDQFQGDDKLEYYKATSLVGHWMSGSITKKRF